MNVADELDIALSLVDRLLERGLGPGRPVGQYQHAVLIAEPFVDLWTSDEDGIMLNVRARDVDERSFSLFHGMDESGVYALTRMDRVAPAFLRKAGIQFRSPMIIRSRTAVVDQQGNPQHGHGFDLYAQEVGRCKWHIAHARSNREPAYSASATRHIQVTLGLMWEMFFQWSVDFIGESGLSFTLPSSPEGAREMFRDRDKPEGKSRRAALRHWVREHSRVSRKGNVHSVAGHLRCAEPFHWRGYTCRLRPSRMDEDRSGKK